MRISLAFAFSLSVASAALSLPAAAVPALHFGEDLGAAGPGNMPNSRAARDQFVAGLAGVGIEGFESFSGGQAFPAAGSLNFSGSSITATVTGGSVLDAPFNARFAVNGSNFLSTSFNQRITFSAPVAAFGLYVVDANELDNDPALVTVGGQPLSAEQIAARPFDSVDGIFRILTERSPGNFEVLFDAGTFPALDSSAMFVGLVDAANPYSNIILINGTSGLDSAFQDGFGYDDFTVAQAVPEPATWGLMMLGALCVVGRARRNQA